MLDALDSRFPRIFDPLPGLTCGWRDSLSTSLLLVAEGIEFGVVSNVAIVSTSAGSLRESDWIPIARLGRLSLRKLFCKRLSGV